MGTHETKGVGRSNAVMRRRRSREGTAPRPSHTCGTRAPLAAGLPRRASPTWRPPRPRPPEAAEGVDAGAGVGRMWDLLQQHRILIHRLAPCHYRYDLGLVRQLRVIRYDLEGRDLEGRDIYDQVESDWIAGTEHSSCASTLDTLARSTLWRPAPPQPPTLNSSRSSALMSMTLMRVL